MAAAFPARPGVRCMPSLTAWSLAAITLAAAGGVPAEAAQSQRPRAPGTEVRPPLALEATGNRPRPPGHGPDPRPFSRPPPGAPSDPLADRFMGRPYAAQTENCEPSAADVRSGPALVAYLQSVRSVTCFNILYDGPEDLRRTAFRDEHVRYVMDVTADVTRTYDGTNSRNLKELFSFARVAFFNEFYLDEITFSRDVYQSVQAALDEFIRSPHFGDATNEHGLALAEVFVVFDSISHGHRVRYLPVVRDWLAGFGPSHIEHWEQLKAANALMNWFYRGHDDDDFLEAAFADPAWIGVLGDLALSDHLLRDPRLDDRLRGFVEVVLANFARELGRFIHYDSAPIRPAVETYVKRILAHYDPLGEGASIWFATAGHVFYRDDCAAYDICGASEEIERAVLSIEHSCSDSVLIRAQSMTSAQLLRACDELFDVEVFFHDKLGTDHEPLPGDHNTTLEVVVYTDWSNYNTYSSFLFDHNTNNGGIYLEGDPSNPGNVARFFAHLADWLPDTPVWNLQHEYVHYLDGRFNLAGDFGDLRAWSHKTVWWSEGLAEYISFFSEASDRVTEYLQDGVAPLHEIFAILGYRDLTLYPKGHLAMWFMFDRHLGDIYDFRGLFRAGDYDGYLEYIDETIGTKYDAEFRQWIGNRLASFATN